MRELFRLLGENLRAGEDAGGTAGKTVMIFDKHVNPLSVIESHCSYSTRNSAACQRFLDRICGKKYN